jgi:major membrane immunogen (membrane-anchored lipoprotein)
MWIMQESENRWRILPYWLSIMKRTKRGIVMRNRIVPLLLVVTLILLSGCTTVGLSENAGVKTGLAIVPSFTSSKAATADAAGLAEVDATYAGVLVGADGKIVNCSIDVYQAKVNFDATGKITSDLTKPVQSKNVLGEAYGMKAKSGIGKEWNEQAAALAAYCVGKTAEEVGAIALDEQGTASAADVRAGATIHIGDLIKAVVAACQNAQDLGAKATDKLGIASEVDLAGKSKDATADAAGVGFAYAYYTATTFGADGKITSSVLNASQFSVQFDATGKIVTDLTAPQQDKQQLKEAYGMKAKSGIGKEWYEQANFFAEYVKGKTAEEVAAIAVDEKGHATSADVLSGATVGITDFQKVIAAAATMAK